MKIKKFRWWIVCLLALVTALNYLDRQNFPLVYSEIKNTIPISDTQYGLLGSLFLFAYGTMYAVGGRIIDLLGSKIGYAIIVIWWSFSNMLNGLVSSFMGLSITRFLLGMGEGGGFPASAKVVSEWFPKKERSYAFGIFNTGSSLGAVVAPILIFFIVNSTGSWRWTFIIFGLAGLLWVIAWLKMFNVPGKSKYVTEEEKKYLTDEQALEGISDQSAEKIHIPWIKLLQYRELWGLLIMKFLTDAAWYFFIFWLPKYLNDNRGLDIQGIGKYAWIPFAFAAVGSFVGGWLSSFLIKKHFSLDASRKISLGIAAALLPASLLITSSSSVLIAVFFFGIAMMGHQFFSTIVQTLAVDMFPSKVVGSVSGLVGCFGTYGGMIFSLIIGFVIQNHGYTPAFLISGFLHPLSFLLLFLIIRKIAPVRVYT